MKRKQFKTGFVLQKAFCDICKIEVLGKFNTKFYELKEDLIYEMQDHHDQLKPVSCSGKLTVIFDNAIQEI